jgi:plastocyanin
VIDLIGRQGEVPERESKMRRILFVGFMVVVAVSVVACGTAWAGANVRVTREENKPDPVEVKVGEEVAFINVTGGGHAHISFEGNDAVQFNVGHGPSQLKFDKPGTYRYTVHLSGVKAHAHSGTVIVK